MTTNNTTIPAIPDFNALPRSEQAVAIARDVLALLDTKKVVAENGCYFESNETDLIGLVSGQPNEVSHFRKPEVSCHACAIGALFVAKVLRQGQEPTTPEDYSLPWHLHNALSAHFDEQDLRLLECAFEIDSHHAMLSDPGELVRTAVAFGDRYATDRFRLTAICENIIANNGRFIPSVSVELFV